MPGHFYSFGYWIDISGKYKTHKGNVLKKQE